MPSIKVSDLAYSRIQSPDLRVTEQFLTDFGLVPTVREPHRLFFRGTAPSPYCYVVEEGPSRYLGFGFHAKSRADLEAIAEQEGLPIEAIDAPGGGSRVRLKEPNGYDVDVVFGIEPAEPIAISRPELNTAAHPLRRVGRLFRIKKGEPTPVRRLAHVVLSTPIVPETWAWFREKLGLIASDDVVSGPEQELIGSFMRIDEGETYVDHHSVFLMRHPTAGLQHISFEAQDVDAVFADHGYLKGLGRYEHLWGIGRHLLGSQIFDYWADPYGYAHEHWADTDRLNASTPTNVVDKREGLTTQWGVESPERFRNATRP